MKKSLYLAPILLLVISCSGTSKLTRPEIQTEISISELNEKGFVAINSKYKRSYLRVLPYLFDNRNGTFNEIQGDFYNVKFNLNSDINIMPGFWNDYGNYQNSLIVLIAMSGTSTLPISNIPISVASSKYGSFEKGNLIGNTEINTRQQRVLFVKKLELESRYDILNKIKEDVITIKVGGQIYRFINPEMDLD